MCGNKEQNSCLKTTGKIVKQFIFRRLGIYGKVVVNVVKELHTVRSKS